MATNATRWRRLGVVTLAVLVLGGACSGSETPAVDPEPLDVLSPNERQIVADAQAWLEEEAGLELAEGDELRFARLEPGPAVTHVTFGHVVEDHPVVASEVVVHVLADGEVQDATNSLTAARPVGADEPAVEPPEAEEAGVKAVPDSVPVGRPDLVWYEVGGELRLAWRVSASVEEEGTTWRVIVDATTGDVISTTQQSSAAADCDAPAAPSACVFIPDPVFANGGRAVSRDQADGFLSGVELQGLDDPASGVLTGEFVDVAPQGAPILAEPEPDGTWELGVDDVGFEHANVYYWIDRTQRLIQRLGFTDIRNGPLEVYANVPGEDFISHFNGEAERLSLGINALLDGEDGEDAYLILHEYGHALLDDQQPNAFGTIGHGRAYHESFGNQLALLATLEHRTAGPDAGPACLGYWSYGTCIGGLDRTLTYPDDVAHEEHLDGDIWTNAIYEVFRVLVEAEGLDLDQCFGTTDCLRVRDRLLQTIFTMNGYLPVPFTFDQAAAAFLRANEAVAGGANAGEIEAALAAHGFSAADGAGPQPFVGFMLDHPQGADLDVTLDVIDPEGNPLCETVDLFADRIDAGSVNTGVVDLDESDCLAYLPPSPQQRWVMRIENRGDQAGNLWFWGVGDGQSGDAAEGGPVPPGGSVAFALDGSGQPASPGSDTPGGDDADGGDGPVATIQITHTYTGDLAVQAGVARRDGRVVCSVQALDPQPGERGTGSIGGDIDLSSCADAHRSTDGARWFVAVADLATADQGTVDELTLTLPGGEVLEPEPAVPAPIPDADPDGIAFTFAG